jgi:hypothetical protein
MMEQEEIEVLYHGTKFKKDADKILKDGFSPWSYFAADLNTAIGQGGKYVFLVCFLKSELPDNWQVRCENRVLPDRIMSMSKFKEEEIFVNKITRSKVYDNATECSRSLPYTFKESGTIYKVLKKH